MTAAVPTARSLLLAGLALFALSACDQAPPPAAGTTASGASAASAPAGPATVDAATAATLANAEPPLPELGDFRIVSVLVGNAVDGEHVVTTDQREFAAKDPIYASVLSIGAHQGLKLSADWLAPDGSSFAKSEQLLVPSSDLATTFNVRHPAGWPSGDYQLRIAINGHTLRTEKFSVR